MTKKINESIDSLERVVTGELGASVHLDTAEADAYNEEKKIDHRVEEIKSELDKRSEPIIAKEIKTDAVKNKSIYTKQYTLDESIADFDLKATLNEATTIDMLDDEDDEDTYLDFTMQDFVMSLANYESSKHATVNPIEPGKKYTRFRADAEDGYSQITTDGNGNVILGSDTLSDFDYIMKILDYYKIDYEGPKETRFQDFKYHLYIDVPKLAPGYPMLMVDYFEDMGMDPGDAMTQKGWGDRYRARQKKVNKELVDYGKSTKMRKLIADAIAAAKASKDIPIQTHLTNLYAKLDELGVKYSKTAIKQRFNSECAI